MEFTTCSIDELDAAPSATLDSQAFGIVKMSHDGKVTEYNSWQSTFTGMSKSGALGKHFFSLVAPCMNNFMVAQKYEDAASLDESLDYTFTLKMAPTPVKLRLLKGLDAQYLLCTQ